VEAVTETPTEPMDYAALSAAYSGLLATLVLAARSRRTDAPLTGAELVPLGLATFALSKVIAHEKVETWLRAPFTEETETGEKRPRGQGMRYAVGELLTCTRCLGAWSALGLVGLRMASPPAGQTVIAVMSASAANDFLQSGFRLLCERSNEAAR